MSQAPVPEPRQTAPAPGRLLLTCVLLVGLTLVAYATSCSNGFVYYDEPDFILDNPHVKGGLTPAGLWWALTTFLPHNWHPLTWMSYQLDHELYGLQPWGYHLTNLIFHTTNVVLLFLFVQGATGWTARSALVAAFFAVHPQHVQSVAWIAQRKDLLCTFFGLLALLAYLRYVRKPSLGRYLLVVLAFILSLMSKQMLVTLPCLLLLLDYWPLRRGTGWLQPAEVGVAAPPRPQAPVTLLVGEKLPLFLLSWLGSQMTWAAQVPAMDVETPFEVRLGNALVSTARYVLQTFWPANLAAFYPHPGEQLPGWQILAAALFLAALSGAALLGGRVRPYFLVGWLWFLGTLVPVVGLVQVGEQAMADRYMYIPAIGLYMLVIWCLSEFSRQRPGWSRLLAPLAGIALLGCVLVSWQQVSFWHDPVRLFERVVAISPQHGASHATLGIGYNLAGRTEEAAAAFRKAIELSPWKRTYYFHLAATLRRLGQNEEADAVQRRGQEVSIQRAPAPESEDAVP